jgi:hypothetical protein
VDLLGASDEGLRFRIRGICRGGHMEFTHPAFGVVRTSAITNIRQLAAKFPAAGWRERRRPKEEHPCR